MLVNTLTNVNKWHLIVSVTDVELTPTICLKVADLQNCTSCTNSQIQLQPGKFKRQTEQKWQKTYKQRTYTYSKHYAPQVLLTEQGKDR